MEPTSLRNMFKKMLDGLAGRARPGRFRPFLKAIESRTDGDTPLSFEKDRVTREMLRRIGLLTSNRFNKKARRDITSLIELIHGETSRSPLFVSVILRTFAAGCYGVVDEGLCGDVPNCPACPVTVYCNHYKDLSTELDARERSDKLHVLESSDLYLTDAELLAELATGARFTEKTVGALRNLLLKNAGLRGLARKTPDDIRKATGLSKAAAEKVKLTLSIAKRYSTEKTRKGRSFASPEDFFEAYHEQLRDFTKEVFLTVLLDQKNRFLKDQIVSMGSLTSSVVHPREVFELPIKESAARIVLIHNHPSGDPMPSQGDIDVTERLIEAGDLFGIRVLDHIVIGKNAYTSFVDEGFIEEM